MDRNWLNSIADAITEFNADEVKDTDKLINGEVSGIWMFLVLLAIGIILYIFGVLRFNKRDLPL